NASGFLSDGKPSYLDASVFSDIFVDILSDKSAPSVINSIKNNLPALTVGNTDLQKIVEIYLQQANGDLQRFKMLIEDWYDESMGRVSGWYKKQAAWILF